MVVAVEPSSVLEETDEDSSVIVDVIAVVLVVPIVSRVAFVVVSLVGAVAVMPDDAVVEMAVVVDFPIGKKVVVVVFAPVGGFFVVLGVVELVSAVATVPDGCDAEVMTVGIGVITVVVCVAVAPEDGAVVKIIVVDDSSIDKEVGVIPVVVSVGISDVVATFVVVPMSVTATVLLVSSFPLVVAFVDVVASVFAALAVVVAAISSVVGDILVTAIVAGDVWSRRDVEVMAVELCNWVVVGENIGHKRHCEIGTPFVVEAASFVIFINFFNVVAFVDAALVLVAAVAVLVYSFSIAVVAVVSADVAGVSVELLIGVVVIFAVFNGDPAVVRVAGVVATDADDEGTLVDSREMAVEFPVPAVAAAVLDPSFSSVIAVVVVVKVSAVDFSVFVDEEVVAAVEV
ncbi:unnamed protein product [Haemonchus placei]|uniref:Uncharacterized protein n=1 Tax=Haemonchus placei TaxID=6290 RepID=A0A0N4WEU5_HAEPC|nr:unnamed protein product [Haemonchus placei]